MELREKAIIRIVEKDQPIPVLSELSDSLQRLPGITALEIKKDYNQYTKGEIDIAVEIFIAIGTGILSSVIYDLLKNIWRRVGTKNKKLKIEVESQTQTEIIELCYDNKIEDIKITLKKVSD